MIVVKRFLFSALFLFQCLVIGIVCTLNTHKEEAKKKKPIMRFVVYIFPFLFCFFHVAAVEENTPFTQSTMDRSFSFAGAGRRKEGGGGNNST